MFAHAKQSKAKKRKEKTWSHNPKVTPNKTRPLNFHFHFKLLLIGFFLVCIVLVNVIVCLVIIIIFPLLKTFIGCKKSLLIHHNLSIFINYGITDRQTNKKFSRNVSFNANSSFSFYEIEKQEMHDQNCSA